MRTRYVKYSKTVRTSTGVTEHAELSVELERNDFEEEAMAHAKAHVNRALSEQEGLRTTLGALVKPKVPETTP